LVGGGGTVLNSNHFCIKGDTTLILREVVARWTYGSNFAGVQIGNSKIALYKGVVDTLEGTGRDNDIHVGDGRAEVHGGQVDWFLSGGGYDDDYQLGNVSVEVYDEPDVYVNASMGGTYGYSNPHYISGDSTIVVRGGNFSGTARDSPTSGFSAGPSNHGYIFGNAAVTLDLRGNEHGFSIEKGDSISGGRRLGADSDIYLGATEANTITLTILADESAEDLLNGLNIYGDCKYNINNGTNADNTRAGKIIININAPGANIGNVYATNYPNITSASVLRRDVQINLVSAKTIMGLSAGNEKDDITDTVFANSVKVNRFAVINVGPRSDDPDDILYDRETGDTEDGLPHRINVSTNGINGFTTMNIARRLLIAQTGNIKNGANATPANHGSYNTFGTVFLEAGEGLESSGIGIESDNAVFIAGHAVVRGDGKAYIESTGKPDQIVFTSVTVMESDSALTWLKVGTQAEANGLLTGWFGATSGWRVITVNPRPTDVGGKITPVNFGGLEATTGKTFIGDYDTHFGDGYNDYVVAIPGSVYTWEVTAGEGTVSHNAEVSTTAPPSGTTITAYGTVQKDTPTKEGSIVIPGSATVLPTFTFTPEASYEEWVKSVDIVGSDQYTEDGSTHTYTIARGDPKEAKTWKPDSSKGDNLYSFDIEAKFSSEAEVFANNVIITAEEAKTITQDEIIDYTDANGRPFFTNNIGEVLNPIKESLDSGQKWRTHSVTFTAGDADVTGTTAQKTVLIIVVTDDMAVSSDRQCAVYAEDATIGLSVAQAMTSKTDVNAYTDAFVLLSDGTTTTATMDNALSEFTSLTEETLSKDGLVPVQYIYTTNTKEEVDKWVVVTVVRDDVNLTVSNTVTGDYADRTKDFTFTVTLWSSSNALFETGKTISFTGGTIGGSGATAPADGTLTVGSNGEVTFNLKHGQTVTLAGVSATGYVQIVESARENYSATIFTDSADADGNTYDTGKRLMTGVDRTFSFENARNTVVPTGVITGNPQRFILPVLFLLLMSALGAGLGIRKFYLRHRRNR
jgi:hypothetical protein